MHRRQFGLAALAGVSTGLGFSGIAAAAPEARTLKFGQSASLSGGQASYGKDVRDGIAAAFAAANANAASTGLRFELQTLDDGGVRSRCLQNVLNLTESGAAAIIGLTSGAGAEACLPVIEDAQIALLGTASGNMGIRSPKAGAAYHVRAGYDAEYMRMVSYAKDFGLTRVAIVTLADTSQANLQAMTLALATMNVKPALSLTIDRNATSFEGPANELLAARPDCVLFTANAAPIAKIIDHMHRAKFPGLFYATSFAGQDLIDALTAKRQSCVMSMVVPRPTAMGVSVVAQCQRDIAQVAGARMGITTLEGYIAGRTAVQASLAAHKSGSIGRSRLREVIAGLRADLGGYRVEFAGTPHGSRYVDLIAVDRYGRLVG
ncbi:ABC transporter substrate-binding protein [Aquincola sp. S2]|uniref:ABC transporter substrate-binding protein n=1 Tax=Pseudaquabacterium terrae TaxID=2732868 RepID=A0ABX2EHQ1_9BURK|nr:ABC transporter substrate-binding protein [Aquabacterium terrae]NRF68151.1 ABC transporter substrate-binding protein [Aquabacterium terrae]